MRPKPSDIEERIAKDSRAMDNDPFLKGTKAVAKFGAPYQRLMARQNGSGQATFTAPHRQSCLSLVAKV
jgi:hypothetical protein